MDFHHWFLPHRHTHKKAHLISWYAIASYLLIFMLLQIGLTSIAYAKPGILGTSSSITIQQIIELTNSERSKAGLNTLQENQSLNQAAAAKASNMFAENYWAHFAPSGKTPWDFINGAGYRFSVAGENLAKNFTNSQDVVTAWMNSPTHRDNIVNPKYRDIGIAVEDGTINGEQTTLVVQMFGTTNAVQETPKETKEEVAAEITQQPIPTQELKPTETIPVSVNENSPPPERDIPIVNVGGETTNQPAPRVLIDPFQVTKSYAMGIFVLISGLLLVDFYVLRRRGVFRVTSHHFAHMAILGVAATSIITSTPGEIDCGISTDKNTNCQVIVIQK